MRDYLKEGDTLLWQSDEENLRFSLQIEGEISHSGGKQTLRAKDIRTKKKYFLKVIYQDESDSVFVEKESKIKMYCPFIIRIYGGMYDAAHGRFITLMEYVDCQDLSDLVRSEKIPAGEEGMMIRHCIARKFLHGICHYMTMYDEDPIVHRDLKPENIMACEDGSIVKIVDFDWVHLHDSNVTYMERRQQKGTPGYADPAFWNSYVCKREMDIYSAGLVLYFLYTGEHHFYGTEEINRYMVGDDYAYTLKPMPRTDPRLASIIRKMIAPLEERYKDIRQVIGDFERYLEQIGRLPELPELFEDEKKEDTIRFCYRIGEIRYNHYIKNYRFLPVVYGKKQVRSRNGEASGHILSFYRVGSAMKVALLHKNCKVLSMYSPEELHVGDQFAYEGVRIEILKIQKGRV